MSDSLWSHGLQHARLPCPSPAPRAYSNSCPSSRWCHPTISSSAIPFSSSLQSFPASGSFQISQLVTSGGQSIEASASVLPMNIQDWFPLGLTGKCLLQQHSSKASILQHSAFFTVQLLHLDLTTGKTIAMTRLISVSKIISLFFNMLSRLVIAFLPRSKCLLISWLQSPSAVILKPKKIVCHCFHCFPIYLPWSVLYKFIYSSVYPSIYPSSIHQPIYLSIYLPIHLSIYLIYPSIPLSIYPSIHSYINLSIHLSIHLPTHLSISALVQKWQHPSLN